MNNETYLHSPDAFMFSEFEIHASIFHKKNMNDYIIIIEGGAVWIFRLLST